MVKPKSYATRAAVEEPPRVKKSADASADEEASAMATAPRSESTAPPRPRPRVAEPDFGVFPVAGAPAGVWQNDKRVTALWGTIEDHNSWVLVAGVGWKKLAAQTDSAALALTVLASHGKLMQSRVDYREEADGCIHELYVW